MGAINLNKKELDFIKAYRYKTGGLTPLETYIFDPFWTFIANNLLPNWLAPNLMTIAGLLVPIIQLIVIGFLDASFTAVLPAWVWFLCTFGLFWYQTIDATDGKQARRTDNCSPLGQILDHNLDQISFTIFMCHVCAMLSVGDDIWRILALTPGVMSAHYSIEYRTHFTGVHTLVVGFIGATEQLCIVMAVTLFAGLSPGTNSYFFTQVDIPFLNYTTNYRDIVIFFSCVSGLHYNLENIIRAFMESKEKLYAIGCLIPYAEFLVMMYFSSYSRFFSQNVFFYICMNGLFLLYVNGIYNLNSTAGMKFNWFYVEPFIYLGIIYLDFTRLIQDRHAIMFYIAYTTWISVNYLVFMHSLVDQICTYMQIRFLKVKPVSDKKTH